MKTIYLRKKKFVEMIKDLNLSVEIVDYVHRGFEIKLYCKEMPSAEDIAKIKKFFSEYDLEIIEDEPPKKEMIKWLPSKKELYTDEVINIKQDSKLQEEMEKWK